MLKESLPTVPPAVPPFSRCLSIHIFWKTVLLCIEKPKHTGHACSSKKRCCPAWHHPSDKHARKSSMHKRGTQNDSLVSTQAQRQFSADVQLVVNQQETPSASCAPSARKWTGQRSAGIGGSKASSLSDSFTLPIHALAPATANPSFGSYTWEERHRD